VVAGFDVDEPVGFGDPFAAGGCIGPLAPPTSSWSRASQKHVATTSGYVMTPNSHRPPFGPTGIGFGLRPQTLQAGAGTSMVEPLIEVPTQLAAGLPERAHPCQ
jgi:hypothetical protein